MSIDSCPFPPELAAVDATGGAARLELDEALYPLPAIYGAAYVFIDRCWVLLDRPQPGRVRATLAPKDGAVDDARLMQLAGEFANELLSCAWRHQITLENRGVIEEVTARALSGAMGLPSLNELADYDFGSEKLEDPLGIALSWEEKHKKKTEAKAAGAPAALEEPK